MTGPDETSTIPADSGAAALVASYLTSFATRDPERIAAHVTADFVNDHTSALGTGCEGRDTYIGRLPGFLAAFDGVCYEPLEVIADGAERAAALYRMTATSGEHPVDLRGAMFFEMRDGLIARRTDIWDSLTYLRQTGQHD